MSFHLDGTEGTYACGEAWPQDLALVGAMPVSVAQWLGWAAAASTMRCEGCRDLCQRRADKTCVRCERLHPTTEAVEVDEFQQVRCRPGVGCREGQ